MCGIGGIFGEFDRTRLENATAVLTRSLRKRGPDDQGFHISPEDGIAFVHTRLAILDLSDAGHQPMQSACGRYTIIFNGEIYNYRTIKADLIAEGCIFKSNSDTEVILHLYQRFGTNCVERLAGMFAFAIWDRKASSLFLARDPFGIKPLYFSKHQNKLAFASSTRAIIEAGFSNRRLDRDALARFLLFGSVQEPDTLYDDIQSLPAGHFALITPESCRFQRYFELKYEDKITSQVDAIELTRHALQESVERHFVSDVPVGIFLSGGIDSTSLLALAKQQGQESIKTFCISFEEQEFDEGGLANRSAQHFGTEHFDWRLTSKDGELLFDEYIENLDLPSNDGFNTYCVSKFAKDQGMKVVLSGLGGDELFGSYPSFRKVPVLLDFYRKSRIFGQVSQSAISNLMRGFSLFGSQDSRRKILRLATYLRSNGGPYAAYWTMRSFFTPTEVGKLVKYLIGDDHPQDIDEMLNKSIPSQPTEQDSVAYMETSYYMRNQLLRDSDAMSMAHGLELRVPLVDSRLISKVSSVSSKLRLAAGKRLLIDAVGDIPEWISNAPKKGFRFPFDRWMKGRWARQFQRLEMDSPVRLDSWYRKWTLFVVQQYIEKMATFDE